MGPLPEHCVLSQAHCLRCSVKGLFSMNSEEKWEQLLEKCARFWKFQQFFKAEKESEKWVLSSLSYSIEEHFTFWNFWTGREKGKPINPPSLSYFFQNSFQLKLSELGELTTFPSAALSSHQLVRKMQQLVISDYNMQVWALFKKVWVTR